MREAHGRRHGGEEPVTANLGITTKTFMSPRQYQAPPKPRHRIIAIDTELAVSTAHVQLRTREWRGARGRCRLFRVGEVRLLLLGLLREEIKNRPQECRWEALGWRSKARRRLQKRRGKERGGVSGMGDGEGGRLYGFWG